MARSRNTQPKQYKLKEKVYPRIIVRKPKNGDIHPLSKSAILDILEEIPAEYIYKLRSIELRARVSEPIGLLSRYHSDAGKIILYSQPEEFAGDFNCFLQVCYMRYSGIKYPDFYPGRDSISFKWTESDLKEFTIGNLFYELANHLREINRTRRKIPVGNYSDKCSDMHESRLKRFYKMRKSVVKSA